MAEALRLAKSYVRSEQTEQEIAALEAEVGTPAGAPSADTRNEGRRHRSVCQDGADKDLSTDRGQANVRLHLF